ncbi:hypothetical protein ABIA38_000846 [Embleya sp. AB8]
MEDTRDGEGFASIAGRSQGTVVKVTSRHAFW